MKYLLALCTLVSYSSCAAHQIGHPVDQNPVEAPVIQPELSGRAFLESQGAALLLAGKYGRGSKEWDETNQEWLDSDSDEPYPEDLNEVDGHGYQDSCDATRTC